MNLKVLRENVRELISLTTPGTALMAVVKASAYGHGVVPVAKACLEAGAKWLGVALLEEALDLRRIGFTCPILVLGATRPDGMRFAVREGISFAVFSSKHIDQAKEAAVEVGRPARVHLKIETGMGRMGVSPGAELMGVVAALRCPREVHLEGVFTHFASADAPDKAYAKRQFGVFTSALETLSREGFQPAVRHCANSAATIDLPETHLDMVRPGLSLYGYLPSERTLRAARLKPCLEWKTRITHIKRVAAGTPIGYGCSYVVPTDTIIVTVPVGYADGYPRALSNKGEALFRGSRVRVAGRVCMDQMMLDLGPGACGLEGSCLQEDSGGIGAVAETGVEPGEGSAVECYAGSGRHPDLGVTLLGASGNDAITADEMARWVDTIPHEILTGIGSRVPRVYLSG